MNYNFENFKASADVLEMSAKDFKALVKKRYGFTAKKAKALYDKLNGNDTSISEEFSEGNDSSEFGEITSEVL